MLKYYIYFSVLYIKLICVYTVHTQHKKLTYKLQQTGNVYGEAPPCYRRPTGRLSFWIKTKHAHKLKVPLSLAQHMVLQKPSPHSQVLTWGGRHLNCRKSGQQSCIPTKSFLYKGISHPLYFPHTLTTLPSIWWQCSTWASSSIVQPNWKLCLVPRGWWSWPPSGRKWRQWGGAGSLFDQDQTGKPARGRLGFTKGRQWSTHWMVSGSWCLWHTWRVPFSKSFSGCLKMNLDCPWTVRSPCPAVDCSWTVWYRRVDDECLRALRGIWLSPSPPAGVRPQFSVAIIIHGKLIHNDIYFFMDFEFDEVECINQSGLEW